MNYHSDDYIMRGIGDHWVEALKTLPHNQLVGIFNQGSGNYGLDYKGSDIDTKVLVLPTLRDIALNTKPISTTHVRANEEHIDLKDVRLYLQLFRKGNINFVEILFTPYYIAAGRYEDLVSQLRGNAEAIARLNPYRSVKAMKGMALEKYHALKHEYPSKAQIIQEVGYDPKQLSHLVRVKEFMERFIAGEPYADCLVSKEPEYLLQLKTQSMPLSHAEELAAVNLYEVEQMGDQFCAQVPDEEDIVMVEFLEQIQYDLIRRAIQKELG